MEDNRCVDRDQVVEMLGLEALPEEGGMFCRSHSGPGWTAIYFLVDGNQPTFLHRLPGPELFHFYMGDPVRLLLLEPHGGVEQPVLGTDLAAGQRPQVVAPGGVWQAADCLGEWALLGTTMSPGFEWREFELAEREPLLEEWPEVAEQIRKHTSDSIVPEPG